MSDLLPRLLGLPEGKPGSDGFGQSMGDDIRFAWRSRRMKRHPIAWRAPTWDERSAIEQDPFLGRFADDTVALGEFESAACVVLERFWHGWPDPPRYAVFAIAEGVVWAAADFHDWPSLWQQVPGSDGGDGAISGDKGD